MATTMDGTICISGKIMPTLAENGLTVTKEKIWSANTNRTATGHMVGDIIAIKYKLQCKWNHVTMEQVAAIDSAVSGAAFFTVTFTDPATNQRKTLHMYAGTPSYPVFQYKDGVPVCASVSVDFIEQ